MTEDQLRRLNERLGLPVEPVRASAPPEEPEPLVQEEEPEPPPRPRPVTSSSLEQLRAGVAARQPEPPTSAPWKPPPGVRPPVLTVGDALDLDPADAPSPTTKAFLYRMRASPMRFEPGTQQAQDVRMVPLQRASGEFGLPASAMEKTFRELEVMQQAKREKLGSLHTMSPEDYARIHEQSSEDARRRVASTLGASEARQNYTMPVEPQKAVDDIMAGDVPWPFALTPVGAMAASAGWRKEKGLSLPGDDGILALMRPWTAQMRPGYTSVDVEGGAKVLGSAKEHPLWWGLRAAPISTAVLTWALNPDLTWELGGERGYGSRAHVENIVGGDDAINYLNSPVLGWSDPMGLGDKTGVNATAGTLIGATMLFEPDAASILTLGVGKAFRGMQLIRRIAEGAAEGLEEAAKLSDTADDVGVVLRSVQNGTPQERAVDQAVATLQARLVDESPLAVELTPRTARNAAEVEEKGQKLLDEASETERSRRAATELDEFGKAERELQLDPSASDNAVEELSAARQELIDSQNAFVSTSALRGEVDQSAKRVIDTATGESYVFVGWRSSSEPEAVRQMRDLGEVIGDTRAARATARSADETARAAGVEATKRVERARGAADETVEAFNAEERAAKEALASLEAEHAANVAKVQEATRQAAITQFEAWRREEANVLLDRAIDAAKVSGDKLRQANALAKGLATRAAKIATEPSPALGRSLVLGEAALPNAKQRAADVAALLRSQGEWLGKAELWAEARRGTIGDAIDAVPYAGDAPNVAAAEAAEALWRMAASDSARPLGAMRQMADEASTAAAQARRAAPETVNAERLAAGKSVAEAKAAARAAWANADNEGRAVYEWTLRSKDRAAVAIVRDADGVELAVPAHRVYRLADPASKSDTLVVLSEIQKLKKKSSELLADAEKALKSGQVKKAAELTRQAGEIRSKLLQNTGTVSMKIAEARYFSAVERASEALEQVKRLDRSRGAAFDAAEKAAAELTEAMSVTATRARELAAIKDLPKKLAEELRRHAGSLRKAATADLDPRQMGRAVADDVAQRSGDTFTLDPTAYQQALVQRYGQAAFDETMAGVRAAPLREATSGAARVIDAAGMDALRDVERGLHASAEALRMADLAPATKYLDTVRSGRIGFGARGTLERVTIGVYQSVEWLKRYGDWLSANTIGLAAEPIKEVVRRSFERSVRLNTDLAKVMKLDGEQGVLDWLLTHRAWDGVAPSHGLTRGEKAVEYLRTIASGEAFVEDMVVRAITSAAMPRSSVTPHAVKTVAIKLAEKLKDPAFGAKELVDFCLHEVPKLELGLAGEADSSAAIFQFATRALAQASNQYDALHELVRITGPALTDDAVDALDWFTHREKIPLQRLRAAGGDAVRRAERVMLTYRLPASHDVRGAIGNLFKVSEEQVRLLRLGQIEGRDIYLPQHVYKALNEIPHKLSKEMHEFTDSSMMGRFFDRLLRNWRMVAVNGWLIPRGAIFLNNFIGDWAQMTTEVGLVNATRISLQSAPGYLPFVGGRLERALSSSKSLMPGLLDQRLAVLFKGSPTETVDVAEGALSHQRFLAEGIEDGCQGSINSVDMMEAFGRATKTWGESFWTPKHIQAAAQFLEDAQSKTRWRLYLDARSGRLNGKPMSRVEARKVLADALYDWKTGTPEHELRFIGKVFAFWSFRRGMMKQAFRALAEGVMEPGADPWKRALTGQTKLSRMRKVGHATIKAPDVIDGQDPEEQLDDAEQLDLYGRQKAPWWVDAQTFLGGVRVTPDRKLWHSEVAGRDVTYEALLLPTLTTMDQLVMLNTLLQTTMASSVMAAEAAGLRPKMTTVQAGEMAERNIEMFTEMLIPFANDAVAGAIRGLLQREGDAYYSDKGVPVPRAQAILLRRVLDASGSGDFLAHEDADGQLRMDRTMHGVLSGLFLSFPQVADIARTWAVFDNPAMQDSLVAGLTESVGIWTNAFRWHAHDPLQGVTYEAEAKERALKEQRSALEKEVGRKR